MTEVVPLQFKSPFGLRRQNAAPRRNEADAGTVTTSVAGHDAGSAENDSSLRRLRDSWRFASCRSPGRLREYQAHSISQSILDCGSALPLFNRTRS
jgi:hypothetical protein